MAERTRARKPGSSGSRKSSSKQKRGGRSRESDQGNSDESMSKSEEAQTGGKAMGRPPSDEPDVYVDVPELHVGELNIDVAL